MGTRLLATIAATAALSSSLSIAIYQAVSPSRVEARRSVDPHALINVKLRKMIVALDRIGQRIDRVHYRTYDNCLHIILLENEVREHRGALEMGAARFANPVDAAKSSCKLGNFRLADGYDPEENAPGGP